MSYWSRLKRWLRNAPSFRLERPGEPRTLQVPLMKAGAYVDHDTALKYSALYAGVGVISETIATLPWRVMRKDSDGRRTNLPNSVVDGVLNVAANDECVAGVFRETIIAHAILWGNGYAEIERDRVGRARALWLITPDRMEVDRDSSGRLVYELSASREPNRYLSAREIFHLHGRGFDGVSGQSLVSLAAQSIGLGLAAEQFGSDFFANGTVVSGVLEHPGVLGDEGHQFLQKSFEDKHQGFGKQHRPLILEEGMKWHQLGIPPEDAQLIQSREMQVNDIARWLRLPPHKIGDLRRATFTNIEHQSREFVGDAIIPWTVRLEQEANRKLLGMPGAYTKIHVNALMRGDSQSRADFYAKMAQLGVFSINEIRELEDMDGIGPEGDKRLVQINQTTLEKIGEDEPEPTGEPVDPVEESVRSAHVRLLHVAVDRVLRKERSRAERAAERYPDRESMATWINGFLGGDTPNVLQDYLLPTCMAFTTVIGGKSDVTSMVLSSYVNQHIRDSRAEIWSIFDGRPVDNERAQHAAEKVINDIVEWTFVALPEASR